jgi:hypothetical protein
MKLDARLPFAIAAIALANCSGNFAAGPSQPGGLTPPMPGGSVAPAIATSGPAAASIAKNLGANDAVFPLADAANGFQCPVVGEYSCVLRFNVPTSTPAPGGSSRKTKAKPSPSPSPSPSPVHIPAGAVNATTLLLVRMQPSADFLIHGDATAAFTLPKEQIGSRGFVLQIFEETTSHKRRQYRALYTFNKSVLAKTTLTFAFETPKITIAKDAVYDLVLYAGDEPGGSPQPAPSAASPGPAATASP